MLRRMADNPGIPPVQTRRELIKETIAVGASGALGATAAAPAADKRAPTPSGSDTTTQPAKSGNSVAITCFIRYQIDPHQLEAFKQYATTWGQIIPRCGGHLLGYFIVGPAKPREQRDYAGPRPARGQFRIPERPLCMACAR